MSLKGFHLFFIAVSAALSIFVFAWALRRFLGLEGGAEAGVGLIALAAICLASALGLAVYGVRVRRKLAPLGEPRPQPRLVR